MEDEENNHEPTRATGRRKRSEVWDHFEHKAECNYCKALLCADPVRDGTSRLKKHYEETCPARHPTKSRRARQHDSAAASDQGVNHGLQNASKISKSRADDSGQQTGAVAAAAEDQLIRMIALHGFPPSLMEDVQFKGFVAMLCPDFKMPSREDLEERCDALFDQEMRSLKDALARTPGLVSLSLGKAQTAMVEVAFLAAHFIDDEWNLSRRVIRVFKVTGDTSNSPSGHILDIKDYDVDIEEDEHFDKVIGAISSLGLLPKLSGIMLNEFGSSRFTEKLNRNNLSATKDKLLLATNVAEKLDVIAWDLTGHDESDPWYEHCLIAFMQLCLTNKKRKDISSRLRLNHPWTYDSRWYVVYYALQFLHDECSSGAAEIAGLLGEDTFQETDTTELFRTILGAIYKAIETVAASSSPTSNLSLIELVKLKRKLDSGYTIASRRTDNSDDEQNDDSDDEQTDDSNDDDYDAQPVFEETKENLKELFEESYLSLSIPLIVDPRFKLLKVERLLKKASLPSGRISEVKAAVRQLFQDYSNHGNENQMDIDPSQQRPDSTLQTADRSRTEQDHGSSQESITELDAYLREKTVPIKQENFDILKWWKKNCHRYPTVARMARDFLAIPVSTRPTPPMMTEITTHLRRYA